jgi:hypothetical protein
VPTLGDGLRRSATRDSAGDDEAGESYRGGSAWPHFQREDGSQGQWPRRSFIEGSVKLTSSDGTVLEVRAGEGAAIPKGWKGHWSTQGYKKYYVTYESEAVK